jgi:hypothetical protein
MIETSFTVRVINEEKSSFVMKEAENILLEEQLIIIAIEIN